MAPELVIARVETPDGSGARFAQELFYSVGAFYDPRIEWRQGYEVHVATSGLYHVGASNVRSDPNRDYAFIAKMAVGEEYRNQGIGSALIRHAVNTAAEAGCGLIAINPTNRDNERLYRRLGFVNIPARDSHRLFLDIGSAVTT